MVAIAALGALAPVASRDSQASGPAAIHQEELAREAFKSLPLAFEPNRGQTDDAVSFLSRGSGYTLFLTSSGAVLSLAGEDSAVLRMGLVGANSDPAISGQTRISGRSNYLLGDDASKWVTGIPHFAKVRYEEVYPGIDLVYYGNDQNQLEYDFVVAPKADPGTIQLSFTGANGMHLNARGDLEIAVADGTLVQHAPVVYQRVAGERSRVAGRYALEGNGKVSFRVGPYDRARPLVIDPSIEWSTYLGAGGDDRGLGIAVNETNAHVYVTGDTTSATFPTVTPIPGEGDEGGKDVFISRLRPMGQSLVYSTYLGGDGDDIGWDIAVDPINNRAHVAGETLSTDFPTTTGANPGGNDAFVAQLSATGSALTYSRLLGGAASDAAYGIDLDENAPANAYVTGETSSATFPTSGGFDTTLGGSTDAFVTQLAPGGGVLFSTFLGGSGSDIGRDLDVGGDGETATLAFVTGETSSPDLSTPGAYDETLGGLSDAFVSRLSIVYGAGGALDYTTYLGGAGTDVGHGVAAEDALDPRPFVTGETSGSFPTTPGAYDTSSNGGGDAFVSALDSFGEFLDYSTYLGGSAGDIGRGIAVETAILTGAVVSTASVVGETDSSNFPIVNVGEPPEPPSPGEPAEPFDPVGDQGGKDAFATQLTDGGDVSFSRYLGGSGTDAGYGLAGGEGMYVTGETSSGDFPTGNFELPNAAVHDKTYNGGIDAFVTSLVPESGNVCMGTMGAITVETLVVPSGADCVLDKTTVLKGVLVQPLGASLLAKGALIGEGVVAEQADFIRLRNHSDGTRTLVGGGVDIKATRGDSTTTPDVQILQSDISGGVTVVENGARAKTMIADSTIGEGVSVHGSSGGTTGAVTIADGTDADTAGNDIGGMLMVDGNLVSSSGFGAGPIKVIGNTVGGGVSVGGNSSTAGVLVKLNSIGGGLDVDMNTVGGGGCPCVQVMDNVVSMELSVSSNTGGIEVKRNDMGGNMTIDKNFGSPVTVSSNHADTGISCKENVPPPTGGGNTVTPPATKNGCPGNGL